MGSLLSWAGLQRKYLSTLRMSLKLEDCAGPDGVEVWLDVIWACWCARHVAQVVQLILKSKQCLS